MKTSSTLTTSVGFITRSPMNLLHDLPGSRSLGDQTVTDFYSLKQPPNYAVHSGPAEQTDPFHQVLGPGISSYSSYDPTLRSYIAKPAADASTRNVEVAKKRESSAIAPDPAPTLSRALSSSSSSSSSSNAAPNKLARTNSVPYAEQQQQQKPPPKPASAPPSRHPPPLPVSLSRPPSIIRPAGSGSNSLLNSLLNGGSGGGQIVSSRPGSASVSRQFKK